MAGKKGRSGRKPRSDGKKMRAVNLYIPMAEMDIAHINDKHAKIVHIPDAWFRQFKRVFGSRWQETTRQAMQKRLDEYEDHNMWKCACQGRLKNTHFKHQAMCPRCEYEPYDLQRYKTQAQVRAHSKDEPNKKALSLCPICKNPLMLEMDIHGRKILRCVKC